VLSTSRRSSSRIACTGTGHVELRRAQDLRPVRVQFWNGVVVKYEVGRINRRSSQVRTTT
jgi:hypothetical protein